MSSRFYRGIALGAVLSASLLLSACDTAEERAEEHFQSGVELLAAGDVERAIVEFRNVFELNPVHLGARLALAELLWEREDYQGAARQYTAVADQYPDNVNARVWLTRFGLLAKEWELAERHGTALLDIAPENELARLFQVVRTYRAAMEDEEASARREAVREAQQIELADDDLLILAEIVVDDLIRDGEFVAALDELGSIVTEDPRNESAQRLKLQLLARLEDEDGIRDQLRVMVDLFPENDEYSNTLVRWYTSRQDFAAAEDFLRSQSQRAMDQESRDKWNARLISYVRQARGLDAALAEVDAILADTPDNLLIMSLRAGLIFESGRREEAIALMEGLIEGAEPSDQLRRIEVALAQMLRATGNEVGARQRIEGILAEDASNVDAIKMQAGWLIREDKADEAIVALRTALDQAPRDPTLMLLMAEAHLRNGNRGLAGEMLALAREASENAPGPTARHARFLIADENFSTAESVLIDALRAAPGNEEILQLLGELYLTTEDWARAEQVEGTLRRVGTDAAVQEADRLRVGRLGGQQRDEEALAYLEQMARSEGGALRAKVAIIGTHLTSQDFQTAELIVRQELEEDPDNAVMRMLLATVLQVTDRADEAEGIYRELLAEDDQREPVWRALIQNRYVAGQPETAEAVVAEALEAMPESPNLLWAQAGVLERGGDIDGAIAVYEGLYERLPESPILANNLASLIATYQQDEESLARAELISRRLRGLEVPAFQDTYGWIAFRRGDLEAALEHLEPAAAGLQRDPIVQYHYGKALAAAERYEEALAQFRLSLEVAGPADTRAQFDDARAEIERIESVLAEAAEDK